jgi:hypothetical protein
MDSQEILAEVTSDPASLGYASMSIVEKLAAINLTRETITFPVIVPKATVMELTTPAMFRIAAMAEPGKTAWLQIMANIRSLDDGLRPSDASIQGLLTQAVADGVLLAPERALLESLGVRTGSRAEQLWGEGAVVTLNDLALVL